MDVSLFYYSFTTKGHRDCFHVLLMTNTVMDIHMQASMWT